MVEETIKGRWWNITKPGELPEIEAKRCLAWKQDPSGYFLIRINYEKKKIEVGLCNNEHKMLVKVVGDHPIAIYHTLIKEGMISQLDHAASMGEELEKAYIALKEGIEYVQDGELDFIKKVK